MSEQLLTFLIGVGTVCGITTFLALAAVAAEALIADYGEVRVGINGDRELTVEGGRSLLSTLMAEGIFIPSACGGRGSCGLCKITVRSGAGDILPTEIPWLSDDERKNGVRLSCQVKVKRDIAIEIPEALFSVREFETRVESIVDLTYDIKEVRLRLVAPGEIEFRAGQFVQFEVPAYALTDERVYRAYSVASDPSDRTLVELEIRLVPNGICTTYVHRHLKVGDRVMLNGPHGDFFLRDTEREIVCVAGGSGMAPIKSILLDMCRKKIGRRTRYFFGARSKKDLFLLDEMRRIGAQLPNFKFIPALSEPAPDDDWDGETGLVTAVLARHLERGDNVEAYLCGSPGMIDACVRTLVEKGVPRELVYFDSFG